MTAGPTLSGAEKTALLLLLLEEQEAGAVLSRMAPVEVEAIGRAMVTVSEASPGTIDAVLDEVLALARGTVAVGDGPPTVRGMMRGALEQDRAGGILERLGPEVRPPWFERLSWLEPQAIAGLLEGEHPQAQALVLANMPQHHAGRLLAVLAPALQADIVRRIALLQPVAPAVIEALDRAMTERILAAPPRQAIADLGGIGRAADLINMAGVDEAQALELLAQSDEAAAQTLSEALFTFPDLAKLPDKALQTLMRSLDADLLIPALRAAPQQLRERLLSAMPQRAAEALADEMANAGPVRIDDAEAAQRAIAAAARRMAAEGSISLPGKGPAFV